MTDRFRTEVKFPEIGLKMNYTHTMFFIGSCFADSIGNRFDSFKFNCLINPFGVMYNPISVANALDRFARKRHFTRNDLFYHNNLWHCAELHGSFSDASPENVLQTANAAIDQAHQHLIKTHFLMVTWGTAWIYEDQKDHKIVANCHKLPESAFERRRLSVGEIQEQWTQTIQQIKNFNPDIRFIFTVSPIRHLRDGAHQNQLSKATLLLASETLCEQHKAFANYFPSYELVLDELRDYRFYASDMIHLSDVAIDFIFEKFSKLNIEPEALTLSKQIEKIKRATTHRFLQNNSTEIRSFAQKQLYFISEIENKHPTINFLLEKEYFIEHLQNQHSFSINLSDHSSI
jgi:hypothetical protein